MGLESATYISGLNASNPVHATDQVSAGDDHLRLIKYTLLASFPNINAAVLANPTELNYLDGVTGVTGSGSLVLSASPILTGTVTAGAFSGSIAATNIDSGSLPDARIAQSGVTQHQAALAITESQISDLGTYLSDNDQITTLEVGHATDTTLGRASAGNLAVEGAAILSHDDVLLTSAKVFISTSTPTGGANGDIWFEREA